MKLYYSYESTPLKFHKAFYKVISPIVIVLQVILMLATIGHLTSGDGYYDSGSLVLNLFFYGLAIIFLSFITYGFAKKKEYAWYMVYAYLGLTVLSNIISAAQAYSVASAVGALIIPTLIGIYYYKRKPLFVTSAIETPNEVTHTSQTYEPQNRVSQNYSNPTPTYNKATVNFCRKCGNRVTKDSIFCNKCGSRINWN